MSKFAKKGLTVNLDDNTLHTAGDEETKVSRKVKQAKADKVADIKGGKVAKPAKGKAAKEVKEKAERAPREADTRKIKLLEKKNPKREGSASYDRYELYKTSKTVAEFIANGGTAGDVRYDANAGYIEVA